MIQTVYIESSVVSYLTGRASRDLIVATHQSITQQWWVERAPQFELVASELVLEEIAKGDIEASSRRVEIAEQFRLLHLTDEARSLARAIITTGPIPHNAVNDALHIAIAAVHDADYLLTWNCKHIANAAMRKQLSAIISSEGWATPIICTPEELLDEVP